MSEYIKLFNLDWIGPWLVEAMSIIGGSLVLGVVVAKIINLLNEENQ